MEYPNRGARPQAQPTATPVAHAPHPVASSKKEMPKAFRIGFIVLLFAGAALVIALTLSFGAAGKSASSAETRLVNKQKYQAVFLAGGQVYFGKITDFNARFIKIEDIYYLRVQQQVQPGSEEPVQDISLAKLGNELHGPEDIMVVNRDQVIFWENLKDDGQVVKAISEYKKNPDAANQQQTPSTTTPDTNSGAGTGTGTNTPSGTGTTPRP